MQVEPETMLTTSSSSSSSSFSCSYSTPTTHIIIYTAFVGIGGLCLPPPGPSNTSMPPPPESRTRGLLGPEEDVLASYSYSFALFAAFDDVATGDDYKRYTQLCRSQQLPTRFDETRLPNAKAHSPNSEPVYQMPSKY